MPRCCKPVCRAIKRFESLKKQFAPFRQPMFQIPVRLGSYVASKSRFIDGSITGQIINTDVKSKTCRHRKKPFERLGLNFYLFKGPLLLFGSTIRTIPVAIIRQCAPVRTGNTPMTDFMQGAGIIAMSEDNLGRLIRAIFR